jgi:hypothetical protein
MLAASSTKAWSLSDPSQLRISLLLQCLTHTLDDAQAIWTVERRAAL